MAWWQLKDEAAFVAMVSALEPALRVHPSFRGFAVFDSVTWWRNSHSGAAAAPGPARAAAVAQGFPPHSATWYVNHSVVLDPARSAAWLSWAQARNVTTAYAMPGARLTTPMSTVSLSPYPPKCIESPARTCSTGLFTYYPLQVSAKSVFEHVRA